MTDGMAIPTKEGSNVTIALSGPYVQVIGPFGRATMTQRDVPATNGVIHVINSVLIPAPREVATAAPTTLAPTMYTMSVVDIIEAQDDLTMLATALDHAAPTLVPALDATTGDVTAFAPSNDAFEKLPTGTLETLMQDPGGALTDLLLNHFAVSLYPKNSSGIAPTLLRDSFLLLESSDQGLIVDHGDDEPGIVIRGDLPASNGIVHVVDTVLTPFHSINRNTNATTNTIFDVLKSRDDLRTLELVLNVAGPAITDILQGPSNVTFFAPTDAAFAADPTILLNVADIVPISLLHIVNGDIPFDDLSNGRVLPSRLLGAPIIVERLGPDDVKLVVPSFTTANDAAFIVTPDILASNGRIHAIDAVLKPPEPRS